MDKLVNKLKTQAECVGCGACIAACPKNAITKKEAVLGTWVPEINQELCVDCGLCEKVCKGALPQSTFQKKAYISYNKNQDVRLVSASGGVFSALATYVLDRGGSVFGAEMYFENGKAVVEHAKITQVQELPRLFGSKYVQSDVINAYKSVRTELAQGNMVLFSGTSCQIAGLKNYLGNVDTTNLYTIDLICHGVPSIDFLNGYISFLEKKHKGVIKKFAFRTKENGEIHYKITAQIDDKPEVKIPMDKSGYYLAFMSEEGYRDACYQCSYASLDKPADITIGDYFEAKRDYPQFFVGDNALNDHGGISCAIAHTAKGQQLLEQAVEYLYLKEVSPERVQKSHLNLQRPSSASFERKILIKGYSCYGYSFVDKYYKIRQPMVGVAKKIVHLLRK